MHENAHDIMSCCLCKSYFQIEPTEFTECIIFLISLRTKYLFVAPDILIFPRFNNYCIYLVLICNTNLMLSFNLCSLATEEWEFEL
jgi:hypothetical protein